MTEHREGQKETDVNSHKHIVEAYDQELAELNGLFSRMGQLALEQMVRAVEAAVKKDARLAESVFGDDSRVDELAEQIQKLTFRMLSLRQPTSIDLRTIIVVLKVSSNLERIGDYAANIAKRSVFLNKTYKTAPVHYIPMMSGLVQDLVRKVLDAFASRDVSKALEVWHGDEEVDQVYVSLIREILTYMMEDPRSITQCIHILFIIRNLERIGDHATDIAEHVHFLIKGEMPSGRRPKIETWMGINNTEETDK